MQVNTEELYTGAGVIRISPMTEHDLLEVVEIEERSALSRWGWAAYYAELQGLNRSLMWVAAVSDHSEAPKTNRLAGYIVARLAAGELHINNVAVRCEFRQRGIGTALLKKILEEAARLNATIAFLELRTGNSIAQALYEKCGFLPVGKRRGYYSNPVEDALTMSAQLRGSA